MGATKSRYDMVQPPASRVPDLGALYTNTLIDRALKV
jgi:hypothetical protein